MSRKKQNSLSLDEIFKILDSKMSEEGTAAFCFLHRNGVTNALYGGEGTAIASMLASAMVDENAQNKEHVGAVVTLALLVACDRSDEFFSTFDQCYEDYLHKRLERNGQKGN